MRPFLWKNFAQPGELHFHQGVGSEYRLSQEFHLQSKFLFEKFGLYNDQFRGKNVLDLGSGSRLRSSYFDSSQLYVIEPLANDYMKLPQSDLHSAFFVSSKPAEDFCNDVEGKIDLVICLNVLDHCYDWKIVIENCYKYNKVGGIFMLSVDLHDDKDPMHPIKLSGLELEEHLGYQGYVIDVKEVSSGEYTHDNTVTYILKKV